MSDLHLAIFDEHDHPRDPFSGRWIEAAKQEIINTTNWDVPDPDSIDWEGQGIFGARLRGLQKDIQIRNEGEKFDPHDYSGADYLEALAGKIETMAPGDTIWLPSGATIQKHEWEANGITVRHPASFATWNSHMGSDPMKMASAALSGGFNNQVENYHHTVGGFPEDREELTTEEQVETTSISDLEAEVRAWAAELEDDLEEDNPDVEIDDSEVDEIETVLDSPEWLVMPDADKRKVFVAYWGNNDGEGPHLGNFKGAFNAVSGLSLSQDDGFLLAIAFDPKDHPRAPDGRFMRLFHASDHEFAPGDVIVPASEHPDPEWAGHHEGVTDYDPNAVYAFDARGGDLSTANQGFGSNVYEIQALGPVRHDEEKFGEAFYHPEEWYLEDSWKMPRARVIRKLDDDEVKAINNGQLEKFTDDPPDPDPEAHKPYDTINAASERGLWPENYPSLFDRITGGRMQTVYAGDLYDWLYELHPLEADEGEHDWIDNHPKWKLRTINLDDIAWENYQADHRMVDEYAGQDTEAPPVILRPFSEAGDAIKEQYPPGAKRWIIGDGGHRIHAVAERGGKTIVAYVPAEDLNLSQDGFLLAIAFDPKRHPRNPLTGEFLDVPDFLEMDPDTIDVHKEAADWIYAPGRDEYSHAASDYGVNSWREVNSAVHRGDDHPDIEALDEATTDYTDTGAKNGRPVRAVVYRSAGKNDWEIGEKWSNKGYTSTSYDPTVAHGFALGHSYGDLDRGGTILRLELPEFQTFYPIKAENELLLPRDLEGVVTSIDKYGDTQVVTIKVGEEPDDTMLSQIFDEDEHPRGPGGRWVKKFLEENYLEPWSFGSYGKGILVFDEDGKEHPVVWKTKKPEQSGSGPATYGPHHSEVDESGDSPITIAPDGSYVSSHILNTAEWDPEDSQWVEEDGGEGLFKEAYTPLRQVSLDEFLAKQPEGTYGHAENLVRGKKVAPPTVNQAYIDEVVSEESESPLTIRVKPMPAHAQSAVNFEGSRRPFLYHSPSRTIYMGDQGTMHGDLYNDPAFPHDISELPDLHEGQINVDPLSGEQSVEYGNPFTPPPDVEDVVTAVEQHVADSEPEYPLPTIQPDYIDEVKREWEEQATKGIHYEPSLERADKLQDYVNHGTVAIRMFASQLLGVLQDGKIKNIHEPNTRSNGLDDYKGRLEHEERVFGKGHLPIYGYVAPDPVTEPMDDEALGWYGDVKINLKPEVKNRTTVTWGDSFMGSEIPSPMNDIHPDTVPVTRRDDGRPGARFNPGEPGALYLEAQIFGGLTLDDIDSVVFGTGRPVGRLKKLLDEKGISYSVHPDWDKHLDYWSNDANSVRGDWADSIFGVEYDEPLVEPAGPWEYSKKDYGL